MKNDYEIGREFKTNEGYVVKVIEYINKKKIIVEFQDNYKQVKSTRLSHLESGSLKNLYHPSVFGKGFVGEGKYKPTIKGKITQNYATWRAMLARCYYIQNFAYNECYVTDEWLNFQVFSDWFYSQKNSEVGGFALDKDLIVIGNKKYSESTCSFVPQAINNLLTDSKAARGVLPMGVSSCRNGNYYSSLLIDGNVTYLGTFDTIECASFAYKIAKEDNIKRSANLYKDAIHPTVYENLMKYEIYQDNDLHSISDGV